MVDWIQNVLLQMDAKQFLKFELSTLAPSKESIILIILLLALEKSHDKKCKHQN